MKRTTSAPVRDDIFSKKALHGVTTTNKCPQTTNIVLIASSLDTFEVKRSKTKFGQGMYDFFRIALPPIAALTNK